MVYNNEDKIADSDNGNNEIGNDNNSDYVYE
jgi:hypothetical protein